MLKMTLLKTLKDLEFYIDETNIKYISPTPLRHEAINWIKYLTGVAQANPSESHYSQCTMAQAAILMQFFNITPDDLK